MTASTAAELWSHGPFLKVSGLSDSLASEGKQYGIHSNVIVPTPTGHISTDKPLTKSITPAVVAWLCHKYCQESGTVIETCGSWARKYSRERSFGKDFADCKKEHISIEDIARNWAALIDMKIHHSPTRPLQKAAMEAIDKSESSSIMSFFIFYCLYL